MNVNKKRMMRDNFAGVMLDTLGNNEEIQRYLHQVACKEAGLPNEPLREEDENSLQHRLYWSTHTVETNLILARMLERVYGG